MSPKFGLSLAVLTALSSAANAQVPARAVFERERWAIGLALGPSFPTGAAAFAESSRRGNSVEASIERFYSSSFALALNIQQTAHPGNERIAPLSVNEQRVAGGIFRGAGLGMRFNLVSGEHWTPYAGAAFGWSQSNTTIHSSKGAAVYDAKGPFLTTRGGFESFATSNFSWFLEGVWSQFRLGEMKSSLISTAPESTTAASMALRLGVRLWFDPRLSDD